MLKNKFTAYLTGLCLFLLSTALMIGCSGEIFSTVDDYRSVLTVRIDPTIYNFKNLHTYELLKNVEELSEPNKEKIEVPHLYDTAFIQAIEAQLISRGLKNIETLADETTGELPSPDIVVVPGIIAQRSWDYEGAVQKVGAVGKSIYYPGPPEDVSYDGESHVITIISRDVGVVDHPNMYYALWTAGIHTAFNDRNDDTITKGVAEAFRISPFIKAPEAGVME